MKKLQDNILHWFQEYARDLPWRRTYSPYHVWISEIMLQQTQMDRVIDYFNRWTSRFPDISSLAGADEEEILKLWEGLGYYARVRNIMKTARILMTEHNGKMPADYNKLLRLPGIGKYTACAIMSIAFNKDYPLVDANIERIFARLFNLDKEVKEANTHAFIWRKAEELLPQGRAREFNQALMELGALVCISTNPRCSICPIRQECIAFSLDLVFERPVLRTPPRKIFIEMATGILEHGGRILIQKRKSKGVWANLWEFPGGRLEPGETPEMALVREYLEETELAVASLQKIITVQHNYMNYHVTLHCYFCSPADGRYEPTLHGAQEYRWIKPDELLHYAFPSGHRKLIDHLRKETEFLSL
ncbi:MAG: A/G-specific adenine glycosylase [Desulfobacterales bacterium SG8_35]|jgi:A/G-specific adenine glycosylase|nr:MAG: A/G-specific adenine glycosylase [Desulfobacterales bacterium SG8_35]